MILKHRPHMLKIKNLLFVTIKLFLCWNSTPISELQLRNATAVPSLTGEEKLTAGEFQLSRIWGHSCRGCAVWRLRNIHSVFWADLRCRYSFIGSQQILILWYMQQYCNQSLLSCGLELSSLIIGMSNMRTGIWRILGTVFTSSSELLTYIRRLNV